MHPAIIRTAAAAHFRHNFTGRAPRQPANDPRNQFAQGDAAVVAGVQFHGERNA